MTETVGSDPVADLCKHFDLLRLRYNIAFGVVGAAAAAAPPFIPMAETIVRGLADADPAAIGVCRAVVDPALWHPLSDDTGSFYGSQLGRLFFAAGGYPETGCTHNVAAAVLGCSRQWIHTLVRTQKLRSATGGDRPLKVSVEGVRALLKAKVDSRVN